MQTAATTFFGAAGHRHLEGECRAMSGGTIDGRARPSLGHLRPGPRWIVGFGVMPPVEVGPSKGLTVLRHLLANRHRPVTAIELGRVAAGEPAGDLALAPVGAGEPDGDEDLWSAVFDDRVRSRVTKLLRRTVVQLRGAHPLLGQRLDGCLTTGYVCRYSSEGTDWEL